MTSAEQLDALAAEYWEFQLREHPTLAHDTGDRRYRRELFHESVADYDRRVREAAVLASRLEGVPPAALTGQQRDSRQLLARELSGIAARHRFAEHLRPNLFPESPDVSVAFAVQRTTLRDREDADDYVERLVTVPAYLDDRRARLEQGLAAGYRLPKPLLARIAASAEAQLGTSFEQTAWCRPFAAGTAQDARFNDAKRRMQDLTEHKLRPSLGNWVSWLRDDYAAHCRDTIGLCDEPQGDAYYALLAREYTTTSESPDAIHAIGLSEVARIGQEMRQVATRAGHEGNVPAMQRELATDARFVASSKDALRERLELLAKRIDRRIPEYFGRIPRMTYGIESVPEGLSQQLPPAYAQPNPASRLSAGVFWVSGLPERCPTYMHVPITLHEAWPGHLMHIALLQEMEQLPSFRRFGFMGYTAYIEGWGLYCEQLGHDLGLYEDPYAHYGQLEMELWRAVRLVVDTGIHARGWTRDAAVDYMAGLLTLPRPTLESEVDRYIGMPGQALAYKIGDLKFRELRAHAENVLGERFCLRDFHDQLVAVGPVTLELLDRHVRAWVDSAKAEAA